MQISMQGFWTGTQYFFLCAYLRTTVPCMLAFTIFNFLIPNFSRRRIALHLGNRKRKNRKFLAIGDRLFFKIRFAAALTPLAEM